MAKKPANNKPTTKGQQPQPKPQPNKSSQPGGQKAAPGPYLSNPYLPYLVIFLFSTGIYFNTLWNFYTMDDKVVVTENRFTQKGFAGIKDIVTNDAFIGIFGESGSKMVSGGRYRPLSIVSFAIEVGLFGPNHPMISHAINITLFTLTCLLLYYLLQYLLPPPKKGAPFYLSVPFITTMLFAGHPVHTEVVANIKGRDEIFSLLFSLLALHAALQYLKTQKATHLIWGAAVFFLALLSKENAVTFIGIIPLTYFFFTQARTKDYLTTLGLYIVPLIVFLVLRHTYTNMGVHTEVTEILDNPFAYLPAGTDGFLQRYATIIMVFILYFKQLVFPITLTHDYFFDQIPIIGPGNHLFLLSLVVNIVLLVFALRGLRTKSIYSYAILFYFFTFSIVSNLVFQVGILMSERFVYMCSVGFCLLVAWLAVKAKDRFNLPVNVLSGLLIVILLLYSAKTISRNRVWVDDLTLFLTDTKTSTNSAKVQLSAGGDLSKLAEKNFDSIRQTGTLQRMVDLLDMNMNVTNTPDSIIRKGFQEHAIHFLKRSLEIYPTRSGAWTLLGMTSFELNHDPTVAIDCYEKAEKYGLGADYDAWYNMGTIKLNRGQNAEAKEDLLKAAIIKPESFVANFNLALSYMNLNKMDSSLLWFRRALDLKPQDALTNYAVGSLYGKQFNNPDMAITYLTKAIEYNPNIPTYYDELSAAYAKKGDTQRAQEYAAKSMQLTGQKK